MLGFSSDLAATSGPGPEYQRETFFVAYERFHIFNDVVENGLGVLVSAPDIPYFGAIFEGEGCYIPPLDFLSPVSIDSRFSIQT